MKRWLTTPVTYGCLIRVLILWGCAGLIFVAVAGTLFNISGSHLTTIGATILTAISILVAIGQWLLPLVPDNPERAGAFELLKEKEESKIKEVSSNQGTGTLIVWTTKENRGVSVYLLPRGEFVHKKSVERDNNKQKRTVAITGVRSGTSLLYVAIFRSLKPGRYSAWTAWGKESPKNVTTSIDLGEVAELELDWKD